MICDYLYLEFFTLHDAEQSSTYNRYSCRNNKCIADKAIDNDITTKSLTKHGGMWNAKISKVIKIDSILIFVTKYGFDQGYYSEFKVETRLDKNDKWVVCKGPYNMKEPIDPHVVQCDAPVTLAKYIRLSSGKNSLRLYEVQVTGKAQGE